MNVCVEQQLPLSRNSSKVAAKINRFLVREASHTFQGRRPPDPLTAEEHSETNETTTFKLNSINRIKVIDNQLKAINGRIKSTINRRIGWK